MRVRGWSRDPVPPARITPFIRGSLTGIGGAARVGPRRWVRDRLVKDRIGQPGPGPGGPRAELAVGQPGAEEAGHWVHPEERAAPAEVPEGLRRVGRPGPVRLFVPTDLHPEAPGAGLEPPEAGQYPTEAGELARHCSPVGLVADQGGRTQLPAEGDQVDEGTGEP